MKNFSGFLFPHSFLRKRDLQRLMPYLEGLKVCQPWFMESLYTEKGGENLPSLEVLRPPEGLKPQEDFLKLLSEYRGWMNDNLSRGGTSFVKCRQGSDPEDNSWEIRKMITSGQIPSFDASPSDVLKWHLILHLAREHQESLEEAEELLSSILRQPGPLREALWENAPTGASAIDPGKQEQSHLLDEAMLGRVIEAWLGLFSSHLETESTLITLDKRVIEQLSCHFEDTCPASESRQGDHISDISRVFPQINIDEDPDQDKVRYWLSGKTVIFLADCS